MTREEFFSRVISLGIDRQLFALDRWGEEDAFNLVSRGGKWLVCWCELGRGPQDEMRFETESDALEYLLSKVSPYRTIDLKK